MNARKGKGRKAHGKYGVGGVRSQCTGKHADEVGRFVLTSSGKARTHLSMGLLRRSAAVVLEQTICWARDTVDHTARVANVIPGL